MLDTILDILKNKNIDLYSIRCEKKQSAELFFIRHNLDISRMKNVDEVTLTIYRDFAEKGTKMRGQSKVFIYPETDREEIEKLVADAYESALYVKNPYYDMPEGVTHKVITNDDIDLTKAVSQMAVAMYKADKVEGAFINSSEFFAEKINVSLYNSWGLNVQYDKFDIKGEFVVQSRENNNDVEIHTQFSYDGVNEADIAAKCTDALKSVKDRAYAQKAPEDLSPYKIIVCDTNAGELMKFYLERANASMVYPGYSDYKKGYKVCEENTLPLITMIPDVPYGADGEHKTEHVLLNNGIIENVHGQAQYLSYINEPQIGLYNKIKCQANAVFAEEMLKEPYILIKNFSDFQMDSMDGSFGGEFRLAYLYDGTGTKVITGGTLNGNIFNAQKTFEFSKETYKDADYEGPKNIAFYIKNN